MQHLTEEDIAVCAEAMEKGAYHTLPEDVRKHLSMCDKCAEEVLMVSEMTDDFRFEARESLPLWSKSQKIIAWSVSVAAAAVFVMLLISDFPGIIQDGDPRHIVQNEDEKSAPVLEEQDTIGDTQPGRDVPDQQKLAHRETENGSSGNELETGSGTPGSMHSAPTEGKKDLSEESGLLAAYEPNEDMEKLVARSQSGLRNVEEVKVQTPPTLTVDRTPFLLEWTNKRNEQLIIEVVDNKGEIILKDETTGDRYQVENTGNGLYYWKLISEDFDLLFCGRIRVGEN
ncbi:MAG: hypothetical protein ACQEQ0_01810 [Bacteroidota bacterium]